MTYDYNQFLIDLILKGDHQLITNLDKPSFDQLKQLVDRELFDYFPEDWKTEEICSYEAALVDYYTECEMRESLIIQTTIL